MWIAKGLEILFSYEIPDSLQPLDGIIDSFIIDVVNEAFDVDASSEIREMDRQVEYPEDNFGYWSTIKAASVLMMFRRALPADVFDKGIRRLVTDNSYKSITSENFYAALQQSCDMSHGLPLLNITSLMESWTKTAGYPTIAIERTSSTISINQNPEQELFLIPLSYVIHNGFTSNNAANLTVADVWMMDHVIEIQNETAPKQWLESSLIIFNPTGNGFYRVNYDDASWRLLIDEFIQDHNSFHYLDRAKILEDLLDFWKNELIEATHYLDLLVYLKNEIVMMPWLEAAKGFDFLYNMLRDSPELENFLSFIRECVEDFYEKTKNSEIHLDMNLKDLIKKWACKAELPACLKDAEENFESLLSSEINKTDLIDFCNVMRTASQINLGRGFHKLTSSANEAERKLIINGLTCSSDEDFHHFILSIAMTDKTDLTDEEKFLIFMSLIENSAIGVGSVIRHLLDNDITGSM